ncbi:uncharacterized protein LOC129564951 [Sitodiplosis mosellana]|uniref:uncharacterized protein LOC129564951 n=1 Tax=Sitodiplosis mosellana TaxID=263140 RepID=UPI0024440183|nr:uncharacterized protein LOC129564951 [Sitodiplosis mosellana]
MVICRINFENNSDKVYYSGELISGTVRLELMNRKKVRGVYIEFRGDAHTEWYEDVEKEEGTGDDRKTVTVREWYRGHENHLNSKIFLSGGSFGEMFLDDVKEHDYSFALQLPSHLPSSFEGEYGHIRYSASVFLIVARGYEEKCKESFTVIRTLDLNHYPSLQKPVSAVEKYTSHPCCLLCCCRSDSLRINARIPVGGFAPGQIINLALEVDGLSSQRVLQFKMELIKHIDYYAQGETKIEKLHQTGEELSRSDEVNKKQTIRMNLQIPPYPPSDETTCGIIKIRYYILITAHMEPPKIHLPITIGTKPIDDFAALDVLDEQNPSDSNPSAPLPPASVVTTQPSAQNLKFKCHISTFLRELYRKITMALCRIDFENNLDKVYYSGQLIRGTVQLAFPNRKKVRGVYIKFKGDAHTEWSEYVQRSVGTGDDRRTVSEREWYESHEKHLRFIKYFAGGNDGTIYLEAGEHVFNFELQLPLELPSSFEGEYGHIRYSARVVLIIPWGFDIKFKQPFTVIRALDLNLYTSLRMPAYAVTHFTSYPCSLLCCFPSDPMRIIARTPVSGYAPGQTINLAIEVDNKSNKRVPNFKAELIKRIWYYAQGKSQTQKFFQTGQASSRGVEVNQKRIIRIKLRIPPNLPSDETTSGIINIRYYIFLSAHMDTCCSDPKLKLPITIGTTPIQDFEALDVLDESNHFNLYSTASISSAPVVTSQLGVQPSVPPMTSGAKNHDFASRYRCTVQLVLPERKKVRGVYIKFKGDANTEWYEDVQKQEGTGDNRKTVTVREWYRSHESYLSSKTFFAGGSDGKIYLEAGEYVYNFELQLPLELPSSFEGEYGHIRYSASVVLIIPWGFDDKYNQSFTLIRALDLNRYSSLRMPVSDVTDFTSYPCCWLCCFPSDPLQIVARIPVGGYVGGQTINLALEVDNKSNQRVPQLKMELIKHIKYYAQGRTKTQKFCRMGEESSRGVEVNQKRIIRINLRIPPNPPSDESTCGIIKISYYVFVTADMNTCCSDPKMQLPITIGTTPIHDFAALDVLDDSNPTDPYPAAPVPSAPVVTDQPGIQPSAPSMDAMSNGEKSHDSAPPYPHDDLPTYEESTDAKGSTANDDFRPRYPFYNHQTSYSKH